MRSLLRSAIHARRTRGAGTKFQTLRRACRQALVREVGFERSTPERRCRADPMAGQAFRRCARGNRPCRWPESPAGDAALEERLVHAGRGRSVAARRPTKRTSGFSRPPRRRLSGRPRPRPGDAMRHHAVMQGCEPCRSRGSGTAMGRNHARSSRAMPSSMRTPKPKATPMRGSRFR